MALITCPECGRKVSDKAVSCPDCGYPINTVSAPAESNTNEEISKLLVLARRAREGGDSINAKRYYDQILDKVPDSWEAIFYSVYYDAMECKIMNIQSAAISVANCIYSSFSAISDIKDKNEQDIAINDIISSASVIAKAFITSATNHYYSYSTIDGARSECSNRVLAAHNIYSSIEDSFKKVFPEKDQMLADFQLNYIEFLHSNSLWITTSAVSRLQAEIAQVRPDYGKTINLEQKSLELKGRISTLKQEKENAIAEREGAPKKLATAAALILLGLVSIAGVVMFYYLEMYFLIFIYTVVIVASIIGGIYQLNLYRKIPSIEDITAKNKIRDEEIHRLTQELKEVDDELMFLLQKELENS